MSRVLGLRPAVLLAVCSAAATSNLPAQQAASDASVSGSVRDPRGNLVPNASVSVKNDGTGETLRTLTDPAGHFASTTLPAGRYTVTIAAPGFAVSTQPVVLGAQPAPELAVALTVGSANDTVTVEAANSGSVAAQYAPMDGLLEARSARTEISSLFIQNFVSPVADYSEVIQMAPGTFSVNSNGVGLGDSKTYFRGFPDGLYDITFDGIPFEDTNSPTHHSWAFFPSQWIGGVDFDRSPGSASTVGPTPFGGSINLLSRELVPQQNLRGGVSYGSFNTMLIDGQFDTGHFGFGTAKRSAAMIDVHRLTSDGFQTYNAQQRIAGSVKYQYKLSEKASLTGFSGVIWLDTNTPNVKGPTRLQAFGNATTPGQYNYLLNNDPTSALYVGYNYYHVPTDFEYVGFQAELGHGWAIDTKPYTYQYNNHQNYANGTVATAASCTPAKGSTITPCGVDKLNSYRKYGANTVASQSSRFGTFRTGLWYEWARTDRFQIPQNVLTRADDVLPNFHENFWTGSYQPYAEYQWQATRKLSLTGGLKYAFYTLDLKQDADNGTTIGTPAVIGGPYIRNYGTFSSPLPSADVNYRLKQNWSVYGQFGTGSVIPPSNVYDVKFVTPGVAPVTTIPKPTGAKTYQTGTVVKLKRTTLNADLYYTHFQNSYVANPDPNNPSGTAYQQGGDSVSKGFEAEANFYLGHGVSFYGNGTAGSARYVSANVPNSAGVITLNPNYNAWVANTPANTESLGMTYQSRYFDVGLFNKRVGPMWNDANGTGSIAYQGQTVAVKTLNQIIPIDPFNVANLFFNYTIRNGSHFDQTKLRLSFNNLFDTRNITSVTQAAKANVYTPGPGDTLGLLPGRSITLTVNFGLSPKR